MRMSWTGPLLWLAPALIIGACAAVLEPAEADGDAYRSCSQQFQRCMEGCEEAEISLPDRGMCRDRCFDYQLMCEANKRNAAQTP